jgi:hypothetical protein
MAGSRAPNEALENQKKQPKPLIKKEKYSILNTSKPG